MSVERLIEFHNKVLANHKRRLKSCKSVDMNVLIQRDIDELEQKIKRIAAQANKAAGEN